MSLQMLSLQPPMALRSRSSGSSTSSLSSTFSDITSSTSASSSSPPKPKTDAFFASPFSTRSPSPEFQLPSSSKPHSTPQPTLSHTSDAFVTPTSASSPSSQALSSKTSMSLLFPPQVFSSRYSFRTPDLHFVNPDDKEHVASLIDPDPSFSSSLDNVRLPTPPLVSPKDGNWGDVVPPATSETLDLSTPRPPHLVPFRGLLLTKHRGAGVNHHDEMPITETTESLEPGSTITIPWSSVAPSALPSPASFALSVALPNADLTPSHLSPASKVGGISSPSWYPDHASTPQSTLERTALLKPASSSRSLSSLSSKIDAEELHPGLSTSSQSSSELRLLKPLGHGSFSSVWLGRDLGRVPLTQLSRRSVRDLRRRASDRKKKRNSDRLSEDDTTSFPGKYDDGIVATKRSSGRLSEGLRNILSLSRVKSSGTLPGPANALHDNLHPLGHHSTLHRSPSSSNLGENLWGPLPSVPSSPFSSNSTLPPLSPLSLNFRAVHSDGLASTLSRDSSLRKFRERVKGTRPAFCLGRVYLDERDGGMGEPRSGVADEFGFLTTGEENLEGKLSRRPSLGKGRDVNERLVAIKITPRRVPGSGKEEEERTRVRFVREVEVLKHISHPNITPLLAHLSSPQHHILILPYLPGGDLLTLVNSDVAWGKLTEAMMMRMWRELCRAVGWMHGVGLVHRDIKLENILLATTAFTNLVPESSPPSSASPSIPPPTSSLIKLADFGLSRFVEINETTGEAELLTTRCGSEAYAAPELVTGGRAGYDARKTDAWACGVVLYAMVGRTLPFGEGVWVAEDTVGKRIGGGKGLQGAGAGLSGRRHWLMKIARGEWVWPGEETDAVDRAVVHDGDELVGLTLRKSQWSRRIVERLLVRDPRKRARIVDLWEDGWMCDGFDEHEMHQPRPPGLSLRQPSDEGSQNEHVSPPVIIRDFMDFSEHGHGPIWISDDKSNGMLKQGPSLDEETLSPDEDDDDDDDDDEGGLLLDHEGIDSITRQEVV